MNVYIKGHLGLHPHFGSFTSWCMNYFFNEYIALNFYMVCKPITFCLQGNCSVWDRSLGCKTVVSMFAALIEQVKIWGNPLMT